MTGEGLAGGGGGGSSGFEPLRPAPFLRIPNWCAKIVQLVLDGQNNYQITGNSMKKISINERAIQFTNGVLYYRKAL